MLAVVATESRAQCHRRTERRGVVHVLQAHDRVMRMRQSAREIKLALVSRSLALFSLLSSLFSLLTLLARTKGALNAANGCVKVQDKT